MIKIITDGVKYGEGNKHVDVIENAVVRDRGRVGFCGGKKNYFRKGNLKCSRKESKPSQCG